jgi:uncharacterized membrane protein
MAEIPESSPPVVPQLQERLQEVARLLRKSGPMEPESQRDLAALVEEVSKVLATTTVPSAEVTHLAESTAHLAETLHHEQDRGVLEKARARLERAVGNAEAYAPLPVGLARRLLDVLANLGI